MDKQNTQRGMQNAWQPIAQHGRAQTPVTRIKISAPQEDKNTFMQNTPEVKAQMLSAPAVCGSRYLLPLYEVSQDYE